MSPLWTASEIAGATGGSVHGEFDVAGATFDSREVGPGDLFIALKGEATDGHRFVEGAFAAGATGALVSSEVAGSYPGKFVRFSPGGYQLPSAQEHISDLDCFHASWRGQRRLSTLTWPGF